MKVMDEHSASMTKRERFLSQNSLFHSNDSKQNEARMDIYHDLEYSMRYFIRFGKIIGLYPSSKMWIIRIVSTVLVAVTTIDWIAMFLEPSSSQQYRTAVEMCGRIGSPQFYTVGTFCYLYLQNSHQKLAKFYEKWKALPVIKEDTHFPKFVNLVSGLILTSAILENISFQFRLFPIFVLWRLLLLIETINQNITSFEVYYQRSHGLWAKTIPFTPYQAVILFITNKLAVYAWNFSDILATVMCRALRHRFNSLNENIEIVGPAYALKRHEDLTELMRLLEKFLSPLIFVCFYLDFYATCMQLHMWMTETQLTHILHKIYLLWAFFHLLARVFLLTYHASRLHDASIEIEGFLQLASTHKCSPKIIKEISRIDYSPKRQLAISGLGCFFITKKFILTIIYVAFSFQIFLMQSDSLKCP